MSRAQAEIWNREGERIAYGLYCGTSDILQPTMSVDQDEPWDIYYERATRADGRDPWDVAQSCDHPREQGYAWSHYGGGFHWPVEFCRECMVVHGPYDWDSVDDIEPEGTWPKDGPPSLERTPEGVRL